MPLKTTARGGRLQIFLRRGQLERCVGWTGGAVERLDHSTAPWVRKYLTSRSVRCRLAATCVCASVRLRARRLHLLFKRGEALLKRRVRRAQRRHFVVELCDL